MPDAYEIFEGRYLQYGLVTSVANALSVLMPAVPRNIVRTIMTAVIVPSVAETKNVWFVIIDPTASSVYPVTVPQSFAADPATGQYYTMVREGMELKLWPGEVLAAYRDSATAGSTIALYTRYIDSPLPLYEEYEPQLRRAEIRRMSSGQAIKRRSGGGGTGYVGRENPPAPPSRGGGGKPEPV